MGWEAVTFRALPKNSFFTNGPRGESQQQGLPSGSFPSYLDTMGPLRAIQVLSSFLLSPTSCKSNPAAGFLTVDFAVSIPLTCLPAQFFSSSLTSEPLALSY